VNAKLPRHYVDAYLRLLLRVQVEDNGCWTLPRSRGSSGHAYVAVTMPKRSNVKRRKTIGAHVVSYWFHVKRTRKHVCHECNNKPCFNPERLYAGTRSQNMKQMVRDGLGKNQFQPKRIDYPECPF
jgi:hypothetical protein